MLTSISKDSVRLQTLFPSGPISRQTFARIIANLSGFLAGLAVVQLDEPGAFRFGRLSELALAFTSIVSVFVALHTLAHVAKERDEIARVSAQVAVTTIVGAAVGSLPSLVLSHTPRVGWIPELFVLSCVATLAWATLSVARANIKYARSSKLRTVSVSFAMVLAEASCVIGLLLESTALRGGAVYLASLWHALVH